MRWLLLLLVACFPSVAQIRLYLKDGDHHNVREYQVQGDRVRYYSTERGEWEEIPLALIDLKRTEGERAAAQAKREKDAAEQDAEDRAERELRREIARVPMEQGVYLVEGDKLRPIPQAEAKLVSDKKRALLKAITQVPLNGKATIEIDGDRSKNLIAEKRPEFYLRLSNEIATAMVKLTPKTKDKTPSRVVEKVSIIPVAKEMIEERETVETFRRQFADDLYKMWPTQPLEPGEYAVIQFTEGKGSVQIWDFRIE